VVPREEIQKNQYQSLDGLLLNYGVQIDSNNPNIAQSQATIRGARTSFPGEPGSQGMVLILVDGRRIGTNNLAMIPMVNVERVEILRGPAAVQYGTSAIGGVVNVITRRGTEKLSASAQGGMGSWETYKGQGSVAATRGPYEFSGGVSYMSAGDYSVGGNNKKYPNTATERKTGYSVNAGYKLPEGHRIGATFLGVNAEHMGSPNYFDNADRKSFLDISNNSADFLYEGGYKNYGLSWNARYFFGRDKYLSDYKQPPDMIDGGGGSFYPRQYYFSGNTEFQGSQGQISFKKDFLTLTGGMDWLYSDTAKHGDLYNYRLNYAYENLGGFALAKIALFDDRLIVSGGLRNEVYWLKTNDDRKALEKTVPSLGVAVHATDWLTLKGNYGESYRIPNAMEMLGFPGGAYGPTIPNKKLKPEEAKSYDAGFEVRHKSLQIGLNYFETEYEKKIISVYTPAYETQYINADGKFRLKGFEGNAAYDLGEAFDWPVKVRPYLNFTALTERSRTKRDSDFGYKIPLVNDLEMGYGLNFAHPGIGFEADLRFTYIGSHHEQDWNEKSSKYGRVVTSNNKTIADLFVRQKIYSSDKAGTVSIFGEARNITNERYALIKDYPQAGRSFFVGLRYDY